MASSENRTLFVGNLSERVTEDLIYELFLQAGPLESVRIPMQNGRRRPFGFVEFKHEVSVPYAVRLFYQTSLYGRMLKLQSKKPCGGLMNEHMVNILPNPLMTRLGPPITLEDRRYPFPPEKLPPLPPPPSQKNPYLAQKRTPSHLMPSPAKKRIPDVAVSRNHIPDSINYRGLISKDDPVKRKNEKIHVDDDLRSKIKKKKKKKKNKEHFSDKKPSATEEKEVLTRGGSTNLNDNPQKSYFKNAVNQIKQHCSRNNRGSYDLSGKHKVPRHIRFNI